jgi:predicted nucleic acid-binding protein
MIILDASVVTKLINTQEEDSDKAAQLLLDHINGKEKIIVPSLLFLEVANALATKSNLEAEYIKTGLHLLYEANFLIYEIAESDLAEAAIQAKEYRTSVYDMVYAVIAKNKECILITSDNKFANKVKLSFVKVLSASK